MEKMKEKERLRTKKMVTVPKHRLKKVQKLF
jgi:hypothetical protein